MSVISRLRALESKLRRRDEVTIIRVLGGLPDDPMGRTARTGEHRWEQECDESDEAFKTRVYELAKAAGERSVVIGGLPDQLPSLEIAASSFDSEPD